jgi:NADP-dependent 3-hydroxy acid dehydrogenase YdfG
VSAPAGPPEGAPLAGRRAIVTGASRGIGAATARALAALGARVACVARSRDALAALTAAMPHAAVAITADLSRPEAAEQVVTGARAALGGAPDIVVHAAGTFPMAPIERLTDAELDLALALHVAFPLRFMRALLPELRARGAGHVVLVGSVADRTVFPANAAYAATKHALRAAHEVLRAETRGSGVRMTLVSPAATDTALWDAHDPDAAPHLPSRAEMLRPEDVADAVAWAVTRPAHVDVEELRLSRS